MSESITWDLVKSKNPSQFAPRTPENRAVLRGRLKVNPGDLGTYIIALVNAEDWSELFVTPGNEHLAAAGAPGAEFLHEAFALFRNLGEVDDFFHSHAFDWAAKGRIYQMRSDADTHSLWLDEYGTFNNPRFSQLPDFDSFYYLRKRMIPAEAVRLYRQGAITVDSEGEVVFKDAKLALAAN